MFSIFIGNLSSYPSVLISRETKPLYSINSHIKYSHQENLIDLLDALLNLAKAKVEEISTLVIYSGPGLFTSLRIGYAFAKAFYLKNPNYKLYTINSLDALAVNEAEPDLIPCLPAQKGEYFYAVYKNKNRITEYLIDTEENIRKKHEGFKILKFEEFPDAEILFQAFIRLRENLSPQDPVTTEPFYVRPPDAYLKLKRE